MGFIAIFWLPILVAATGVFLVSSIIHMATPMHKNDYGKVPNEEHVLKAIRDAKIPPGTYMYPAASSMKDMGNPDYIAKCERGPVGYMTILPNRLWNMGKSLLFWFGQCLTVSILTAYVSSFAFSQGNLGFSEIMRFTGTISIMAYAMASVNESIWKGVRWSITFKFVVDGILYGLTTGAIFAWLWPHG